jgi:hypothetical protein
LATHFFEVAGVLRRVLAGEVHLADDRAARCSAVAFRRVYERPREEGGSGDGENNGKG